MESGWNYRLAPGCSLQTLHTCHDTMRGHGRDGCVYPFHGQAAVLRVEAVNCFCLFSNLANCGVRGLAHIEELPCASHDSSSRKDDVEHRGVCVTLLRGVCDPPKGCEFSHGGANDTPRSHLRHQTLTVTQQ